MWNDFNINIINSECICAASYSGKFCEVKLNPCSNSPCGKNNQNQCVPTTSGSFQCICTDDYNGELCEVKATKNRAPFVASFNLKSFIQRASLDSNLNIIYLVFFSYKTNGKLIVLKF